MNNNWYKDYMSETRRRQEDIKFAEAYRKAKYDPDAPPASKASQRLFSFLGAWIKGLAKRQQKQQPVPRKDYAHERS